jgi:hypothetical protein
VCTGFGWENLRKRDHWGDPGIDGKILLRRIFMKWDVEIWIRLIWLRIGKGDGQLVIAVMNLRLP